MSSPARASPGADGGVLELDASRCGDAWLETAVSLFRSAHARSGVWPAAVHVRNAPVPGCIASALSAPAHVPSWLASRLGAATPVQVHCLSSSKPTVLTLSAGAWAVLCAVRGGGGASPSPPPPPDVPPGLWTQLLRSEHKLYLSALEAQVHCPELAASYNAVAQRACLLRFLPAAAVDPTGPILMCAEEGCSSGWHRDGTPVLLSAAGEADIKAGEVNAFHWQIAGRKRWTFCLPQDSRAVEAVMLRAPLNGFNNRLPAKLPAGLATCSLLSGAGDVVLVAKHAWHCVDTLEASCSMAADRLFDEQIGEGLAASLGRLASQPLVNVRAAVRQAAMAALAAEAHPSLFGSPTFFEDSRSFLSFHSEQADEALMARLSDAISHGAARHVKPLPAPASAAVPRRPRSLRRGTTPPSTLDTR